MESILSQQIRMAAFEWLNSLLSQYPDCIFPSKVLSNNFYFNNERVILTGQQGIWKPNKMQYPISIKSRIESIYDDEIISDNRIKYSYMGDNPNNWVNVGLRECMKQNLPLIYMLEVSKGRYILHWPVFIVFDDIKNLSFIVEAHSTSYAYNEQEMISGEPEEVVKKYATRKMIQRLHQGSFREMVLNAYKEQCAICSLRHRSLLDAAHIIPDREELSRAIVTSGISLCKIHHAAFDDNIIGITPDYKIQVRDDVLYEIDGPMLKFGIQQMHGNNLILPHDINSRPNKELLEIRYNTFKKAV
jgi:putative restriction endonuclease